MKIMKQYQEFIQFQQTLDSIISNPSKGSWVDENKKPIDPPCSIEDFNGKILVIEFPNPQPNMMVFPLYRILMGVQLDEILGYLIIANPGFLKLSQKSFQFFLAHEQGHIELGHLEGNPNEIMLRNCLRLILPKAFQVEVEADSYAARVTDKLTAIEALTEVRSLIAKPLVRFELTRRVNALKHN